MTAQLTTLVLLFSLCLALGPATSAAPAGFATPQPGRVFQFPRDHGSHPEFRIEWWYITGHLWDSSSNRFGFQTTFFRTAAPSIPTPPPHASADFGLNQLFLSHAALLDLSSGTFRHRERLHREGWAAGSQTNTLRVWQEGSSLTLLPFEDPTASRPSLRLVDSIRAEAAWDIQLTPVKPLVSFGTNGVSRKGADPDASSHYLTFPRLKVEGSLTLVGKPRAVRGLAWMDHEFGSSQLATNQTGWDWFSVQLHDGRELMAYRLRHKDGSTDPFSTLAWIDAAGNVTHQPATAFELQPLRRWRSPRSGAEYPSGLRLIATDPSTRTPVRWDLVPLQEDQELPGTIGNVPYWEGACRVLDHTNTEIGHAFIELTGYAGNLSGTLR